MKNFIFFLTTCMFLLENNAIETNSFEYGKVFIQLNKFLDSLTPENIQYKMTVPFLAKNSEEEMNILKEMEGINHKLSIGLKVLLILSRILQKMIIIQIMKLEMKMILRVPLSFEFRIWKERMDERQVKGFRK